MRLLIIGPPRSAKGIQTTRITEGLILLTTRPHPGGLTQAATSELRFGWRDGRKQQAPRSDDHRLLHRHGGRTRSHEASRHRVCHRHWFFVSRETQLSPLTLKARAWQQCLSLAGKSSTRTDAAGRKL